MNYEKRNVIYKIAVDGTSKEVLYESGGSVFQTLQHRGYIYLFTNQYTVDEVIHNHAVIKRINVESTYPKEEILFEPEREINGGSYFYAYGNHFYFSVLYENVESRLYGYNISKKEVYELTSLEQETSFQTPVWYDGKLFSLEDLNDNEAKNERTNLISCSPEGGQIRVRLHDVPVTTQLKSDGNYLYLTDTSSNERRYRVYDHEMNQIDEFIMEITGTDIDPSVGGKDFQYLIFDDREAGEWGLYVWDKAEIGTLNGGKCSQIKVPYQE